MTDNTAQTTETQKAVLKNINKQVAKNSQRAVVNAGIFGASLMFTAAVTYVFPPVGIAAFLQTFGTIFSVVQGLNTMERVGTHFSLMKAKKEVEQDATFAKTEKRATVLEKADKVLTIGALGVIALGVASLFVPPLRAVVLPALNTTLGTVLAAATVLPLSFIGGLNKGAQNTMKFVDRVLGRNQEDDAPKTAPAAPASGLANNSVKNDFGAKADKPAVVAEDAVKPVAPAADAPKASI